MPPAGTYTPPAPASYAADPRASHGRRYPEGESATRTPFARDRDRVIHCSAFRRLKEKTQVFVAHEGDHYRTRLTHSLEVAQIARSIAHALGLDDDLAEGVALAHDLGHPPFAHAGEDQLRDCMKAYGGFDHNVQTFRVVTRLERRYPDFEGLNLCWEMLEGVVKHNGPITGHLGEPAYRAIVQFDREFPLGLSTYASAEAQVAALADDIAYNNHDVDDGLQAGLFGIDDLLEIPLIGPSIRSVQTDYPDIELRMLRLESVRRMIGVMVGDVIAETRARAKAAGVATADDVRAMKAPLVGFSADMLEDLNRLRAFLYERMYRHYRVNRTRSAARRMLRNLFGLYMEEPDVMPAAWYERARVDDQSRRARVVCDYIAGMTDRFAIEEHRRLFNLESWH
ncbi:deoxyguanosinetriphosphate triphosphohydrolase [Caulobacter sp. S45]|uniref:deoxyguanosinetriphosphate triphosphohydrolase n=1 Tax=Caulobacter sp. S45 TaxID=1641861 RepID=UPI0020B17843|nr:deoxyguanosinetriphosphate triphosphohydrolase [Caulobacter sp. S45]